MRHLYPVYLSSQYYPGNKFCRPAVAFALWARAARSLIGRRPDTGTAGKFLQGEAANADGASSQQLALSAGAVAARRAGRALRDRALSAPARHARAEGIARHPSARQVARHHRQRQHDRGVWRDRGIPHQYLRQGPPDPAGKYAGAATLYLLAALCRGLGDVAAALEIAVHADAAADASAAAAAGAQGLQPGADDAGQSAAQAAHGLLGERARQKRMVRRQ